MSERSLLENVDTTELLQGVDVEDVLEQVDLWELLREVNLESVLAGFGAAAGGELGTKLGRRLDATFGTGTNDTGENEETSSGPSDDAEAETDDGTDHDDDAEPTDNTEDDGSEESEPDADGDSEDGSADPRSREDLEALSYRELQTLATDTDVKGNISKDRMVEELAETFGFDDE